jgi:hypothetical protein
MRIQRNEQVLESNVGTQQAVQVQNALDDARAEQSLTNDQLKLFQTVRVAR